MRELDWKIHTLMGNDLTGYRWARVGHSVYKECEMGIAWVDIPHYSTTWEGAGLVMEWLKKHQPLCNFSIWWDWMSEKYAGEVGNKLVFDDSGPAAFANALIAYISAMEERNNG